MTKLACWTELNLFLENNSRTVHHDLGFEWASELVRHFLSAKTFSIFQEICGHIGGPSPTICGLFLLSFWNRCILSFGGWRNISYVYWGVSVGAVTACSVLSTRGAHLRKWEAGLTWTGWREYFAQGYFAMISAPRQDSNQGVLNQKFGEEVGVSAASCRSRFEIKWKTQLWRLPSSSTNGCIWVSVLTYT